jgi:hypothetical protein
MGFGGSAAAMVASIKNNKRERPSAFKKLKGLENSVYKKGTIDKKASPKLLKELRERTIKENNKQLLKKGLFLSTIAVTLFLILWFS